MREFPNLHLGRSSGGAVRLRVVQRRGSSGGLSRGGGSSVGFRVRGSGFLFLGTKTETEQKENEE